MKMKVRIVAVGKEDAKYTERKRHIGRIGTFEPYSIYPGGFRSGSFFPDELEYSGEWHFFLHVKVHKLENKNADQK